LFVLGEEIGESLVHHVGNQHPLPSLVATTRATYIDSRTTTTRRRIMRPTFYVLLGVLLVPTVGLVGDIVTDGTLISTVVPGVPPLQVESTDRVDNLNADMLDGISGEQLYLAAELYTKWEVDALVAAAAAADPRRWYYLTATSSYDGSGASTACDAGFHMASIYEILDVSNLRYDTVRGNVKDDSGLGPPQTLSGWIRTGEASGFPGNQVQLSNCNAWTSSSPSHYGTKAFLGADWLAAALPYWRGITASCDLSNPVWCIED
jgi:hypothetical protein